MVFDIFQVLKLNYFLGMIDELHMCDDIVYNSHLDEEMSFI
ncbi:MAG: hypothetical protein ACT4OW_03100 [Nitrososphaerota archaeon]